MIVLWATAGFILIAAAITAWDRLPLRPRGYLADPSAESRSPVLYARLVPSHRGRAERLPAAASARQVHVITDLPEAAGARGSEGN